MRNPNLSIYFLSLACLIFSMAAKADLFNLEDEPVMATSYITSVEDNEIADYINGDSFDVVALAEKVQSDRKELLENLISNPHNLNRFIFQTDDGQTLNMKTPGHVIPSNENIRACIDAGIVDSGVLLTEKPKSAKALVRFRCLGVVYDGIEIKPSTKYNVYFDFIVEDPIHSPDCSNPQKIQQLFTDNIAVRDQNNRFGNNINTPINHLTSPFSQKGLDVVASFVNECNRADNLQITYKGKMIRQPTQIDIANEELRELGVPKNLRFSVPEAAQTSPSVENKLYGLGLSFDKSAPPARTLSNRSAD